MGESDPNILKEMSFIEKGAGWDGSHYIVFV